MNRMLTKNLLFLFCTLTPIACIRARQVPTTTQSKSHNMERFNIAEFERNQVNDEYTFITKDGTKVIQRQFPGRQEYLEESFPVNSHYSKIRLYYMPSGNIKTEGTRFYKMSVNTWVYYEPTGVVSRKVDWEMKFKFTINDLIAKVKDAYKIDLLQKESSVYATRSLERDPRPFYSISFPVGNAMPGAMYTVIIDGVTGKELEKRTSTIRN